MTERRQRGLEMMRAVYGWDEITDAPDDPFFSVTVEHLFAEVWSREGLSMRDRRLLLLGLLAGTGLTDVAGIQLEAALGNDELTAGQIREIVVFLAHYAGWPHAAKLHVVAEGIINRHADAPAAD